MKFFDNIITLLQSQPNKCWRNFWQASEDKERTP